jgi:hypothetical protein
MWASSAPGHPIDPQITILMHIGPAATSCSVGVEGVASAEALRAVARSAPPVATLTTLWVPLRYWAILFMLQLPYVEVSVWTVTLLFQQHCKEITVWPRAERLTAPGNTARVFAPPVGRQGAIMPPLPTFKCAILHIQRGHSENRMSRRPPRQSLTPTLEEAELLVQRMMPEIRAIPGVVIEWTRNVTRAGARAQNDRAPNILRGLPLDMFLREYLAMWPHMGEPMSQGRLDALLSTLMQDTPLATIFEVALDCPDEIPLTELSERACSASQKDPRDARKWTLKRIVEPGEQLRLLNVDRDYREGSTRMRSSVTRYRISAGPALVHFDALVYGPLRAEQLDGFIAHYGSLSA